MYNEYVSIKYWQFGNNKFLVWTGINKKFEVKKSIIATLYVM